MTPEIPTIIGVGVALASLILVGQRSLRSDIAHLEGLLEGLREAITRDRAA